MKGCGKEQKLSPSRGKTLFPGAASLPQQPGGFGVGPRQWLDASRRRQRPFMPIYASLQHSSAPHYWFYFFAPSRLRVADIHQKIRKPCQNGPFPTKRALLFPLSTFQDRRPTSTKTEKTIYTIRDEMLDGHTAGFVAWRVFSYWFRRAVFPTVDRPDYHGRTRFCPGSELNNWRG